MSAKRPKELKWVGETYGDGRPVQFLQDLEPRDYTAAETEVLTDEQVTSALKSGLYDAAEPAKSKDS